MRLLYLVLSGAAANDGPAELARLCQAVGWRVAVFSTPDGMRFIDAAELERVTGSPVRSEYRAPGTGAPTPPPDAVLACPLTFNSVNKFAHGHCDNFALALLCEMAGYGVPTIVVPHCKPQLASHPAFTASLDTLRGMGVRVLFDPDAPEETRLPPWSEVVAALPALPVPFAAYIRITGARHGSGRGDGPAGHCHRIRRAGQGLGSPIRRLRQTGRW